MKTALLMTAYVIRKVAARGAERSRAIASALLCIIFAGDAAAADVALRSHLGRANCTTFSITRSALEREIATFEVNCGNSGHDIRTVYCFGISCRQVAREQNADGG